MCLSGLLCCLRDADSWTHQLGTSTLHRMQLDPSHNHTYSQPLCLALPAGCGLSAMKEVSFAWNGFTNAMLSNVGMVLRNIYSKKALGDYKDADVSVERGVQGMVAAFCLRRRMTTRTPARPSGVCAGLGSVRWLTTQGVCGMSRCKCKVCILWGLGCTVSPPSLENGTG